MSMVHVHTVNHFNCELKSNSGCSKLLLLAQILASLSKRLSSRSYANRDYFNTQSNDPTINTSISIFSVHKQHRKP